MNRLFAAASLLALSISNVAAGDVSVEEGMRVAIVGGCHDCHTDGYAVSGGRIDPENALRGSAVGFQGPWGTTYPANLRLTLARMNEDEFVGYGHAVKTRPPMPWFNMHAMKEDELRSFYRYVKSLGEPGMPAPQYVEPGVEPITPFIVFEPQMPTSSQ
jgi:mono/diheme cytochrome c family protein